MNDVEGTWDEGLQDAWRGFRHELVGRIAALGWEAFLFVVPTAGYECDEMPFPDLAVMSRDVGRDRATRRSEAVDG